MQSTLFTLGGIGMLVLAVLLAPLERASSNAIAVVGIALFMSALILFGGIFIAEGISLAIDRVKSYEV